MNKLRDFAPITKFLLMLSVIAFAYLLDTPIAIALLIVFQGIVAGLSGVGRAYRLTLLALLVGAVTFTLFQIFSIDEGRMVFTLIPPLGWGRVTDHGLFESLVMSLRMMASVGAVPLMLTLTPSTQIVSLISGTFRLSPAYTCMLVTALRFIPTFGERMGLVLQAEASRGYRSDTANPFRKIGMILRMSLPLLVTCVRDVDTLALSLEARGFAPDSTTRAVHLKPHTMELVVLAVAMLVVMAATLKRFL